MKGSSNLEKRTIQQKMNNYDNFIPRLHGIFFKYIINTQYKSTTQMRTDSQETDTRQLRRIYHECYHTCYVPAPEQLNSFTTSPPTQLNELKNYSQESMYFPAIQWGQSSSSNNNTTIPHTMLLGEWRCPEQDVQDTYTNEKKEN